MAFYSPDGALQQRLEQVMELLAAEGRPQLRHQLSITWLRYDHPLRQRGANASDAASFWLEPQAGASWLSAASSMRSAPAHSEVQAAAADRVVIDLARANKDASVFGSDAEVFNPHRTLPDGVPPWGLTFGVGAHTCLGRDLDGGVLPREDCDPATHQYGIVPLFVRALFERGARPDPEHPARLAERTERPNWGSYPIVFGVSE